MVKIVEDRKNNMIVFSVLCQCESMKRMPGDERLIPCEHIQMWAGNRMTHDYWACRKCNARYEVILAKNITKELPNLKAVKVEE